ncbi:sugar phosphate isomerase/epimerase family protein [Deinococcus aquiradiocola]|uniref:Xylose isomerase n=1 Tax=Deinococcus aquiradiocola TaxID=393059 RepID=A0A917UNI7_9DEIO|nr:sugar phosphate isomerase/epimerase [Deinococcus aquiradiocola]GGJ70688.1 xylose isomerase [Deinococcus aquiradiocola]
MTHPSRGTLSVQLYTFRDAYAADPGGTLARLARTGFRYVEPFGVGSNNQPAADRVSGATALRGLLDEHGLSASSAHTGAPVGPDADSMLDAIEALGVQTVVISWPGEVPGFERDVMSTLDGTLRFADALNEAADRAAARGVRLGFHNHWWEWTVFADGRSAYDTLLQALRPEVFMEVDAYWAQTAGQSPAALVGQLGERVRLLHLKDGPAEPDAAQVPLGGGVIDNLAVIRAAPWVRWHVLEMDRTDGDVFAEVRQSARTLIEAGVSDWT